MSYCQLMFLECLYYILTYYKLFYELPLWHWNVSSWARCSLLSPTPISCSLLLLLPSILPPEKVKNVFLHFFEKQHFHTLCMIYKRLSFSTISNRFLHEKQRSKELRYESPFISLVKENIMTTVKTLFWMCRTIWVRNVVFMFFLYKNKLLKP